MQSVLPTLMRAREQLAQLLSAVDPEFLALGEGFTALSACTDTLVEQAQGLVAGPHGVSQHAFLAKVRELCTRLNTVAEEQLGAVTQTLEGVDATVTLLGQLLATQHELRKLSFTTGVLSVSTKIESAYLQGTAASFGALAHEVTALSARIRTYVEHVNAEIKTTHTTVLQLKTELGASLARQRQEYSHLHEEIVCALQLIDTEVEHLDRFALASKHYAEELAEVVGNIVVALQAHDITRQRMQHVQEVFATLIAKVEQPSDLPPAGDFLAWLHTGLTIQVAQLRDVLAEVTAAATQISEGLQRIQRLSTEQFQRCRTMMATWSGTERATFRRLQAYIKDLGSRLTESMTRNAQLLSMGQTLSQLMAEVGERFQEIDLIRRQMTLIALNAAVQAARIGGRGQALSVLANGIRELANGWAAITSGTNTLRKDIGRLSQAMTAQSATFEQQRTHVQEEQARAEAAVASLQAAEERLQTRAQQLLTTDQAITEETQRLATLLTFPNAFATTLGTVTTALEEVLRQLVEAYPQLGTWSDRQQFVAEHMQHYTMERERHVGAAALGMALESPIPGAAPCAAPGEELGENVELF